MKKTKSMATLSLMLFTIFVIFRNGCATVKTDKKSNQAKQQQIELKK